MPQIDIDFLKRFWLSHPMVSLSSNANHNLWSINTSLIVFHVLHTVNVVHENENIQQKSNSHRNKNQMNFETSPSFYIVCHTNKKVIPNISTSCLNFYLNYLCFSYNKSLVLFTYCYQKRFTFAKTFRKWYIDCFIE